MFDFIVVGLGIAGWSFIRQLEENRKNYMIFDTSNANSSLASAGVYNPIILKRFTLAWKSVEWLPYALLQYRKFEMENPGNRLVFEIPVYRKLSSIGEQNEWISVSSRPGFDKFMNGISKENLPGIAAPFGFGVMKNTGLIDIKKLLEIERNKLRTRNLLIEEKFDYEKLEIKPKHVEYGGIKARYIVFAEGFGLKQNPFFKHLPLTGTKGESLVVELEHTVKPIVKSNLFLAPVPLSQQYIVGATYNWEDKSSNPTRKAREHLEKKFGKLYSGNYKIIGQKAGIRPTVKDRRPLLGRHPVYQNLFVFNGLGTRGVILAPMLAKMLFENIMFDLPLLNEVDIRRFN